MKPFPIIFLLLVLNCTGYVNAQCNKEYYYKIGGLNGMPEARIIEDTTDETTFAFWNATVDTNCNHVGCDRNYEIWVQKNDACGKRIWKKNIGFSQDTSMDGFVDVLFTPDSNIIILGYGEYTGQGGLHSGTVFKMTKNGDIIWKKAYGGRDAFAPKKITYNPYRNTYLITGFIERRLSRLMQRAYIMEIDSAGIMINEKDILLDYDIESADKKALKFDHVEALNDTVLVGLLSADTLFFAQLNEKLELQWFKKLVPTNVKVNNSWGRPYFNKSTKEFITSIPEKESTSSDSISIRWICSIASTGSYSRNTPIGNYRFPYPLGWIQSTNDLGYILYANHIFKLNSLFQFTDTFPLPHIEEYYADEYYGAPELTHAIQLKSGAYAGIGISGYRSNWDYAEVYMIQTDKDGRFTPDTPQPLPVTPFVSISPNPSYNGLFTIKSAGISYQSISVYNTTGQTIYTSDEAGNNIDLSNKANGLYFITLYNSEGKIVHQQKILLQQ